MLTAEEIAARLGSVRERIAAAERSAGRAPGSVRLILASKTQPAEAIRAAYEAGARDFGENYVQEAAAKREALGDIPGLTWHMIGHLQTNKAALAARTFDMIQTVDSERLAKALAKARPAAPIPALIEVNLGGEASKSGVRPAEVERLIEAVRTKVELQGLMTIPPPTERADGARRYFGELRELRDRVAASSGLALRELSMGMTEDFEAAIQEGATMVRIGRAVLGSRIK